MSDRDLEVVDNDLTWACEECGEENTDPFDAMQHQHSCSELDEREAAEVEVVNEEPLVRVSEVVRQLDKILMVPPANETDTVTERVDQFRDRLRDMVENDSGLNSTTEGDRK